VDHQIDSSADGVGKADPPQGANGTAAPTADGASPATHVASPALTENIEREPTRVSEQAITRAMSAGDDFEWVSPILRGGGLAILAFQIGYTVLDGGRYPHTFPRSLPLHIAGMTVTLLAIMLAMVPRAIRHWQAILLTVCSMVLALSTSIAMINGNNDVLVASIVVFFFGAGALVP
jgi:hypothetical protein